MKKLILIDGNSIVYRAYFATAYSGANLMQTTSGIYTNALFAFINMFEKIVTDDDQYILVAFDTKEPTKRHNMYSDYKAGRSKMPEELFSQLELINEYLNVCGIKFYSQAGYEADDIIGFFSKQKNFDINIYSSDKDLLQLVNQNVKVHLLKKGMTEVDTYTPTKITDKYGLSFEQMIDLKSLMGDKSDNIPGIPGVGEKTAIKLLKKYSTLEEILEKGLEIGGSLGTKIVENKNLALLSKRLVTIDIDSKLSIDINDLERKKSKLIDKVKFLQKYELHNLAKKISHKIEREEWSFQNINTDERLKEILVSLSAVFFEFSSFNYHKSELWGVGISNSLGNFFLDSEFAMKSKVFKNFMIDENQKKLTYNAKAIKVYMAWNEINVKGIEFDLLLSAYTINAHLGKEEFKRVVANFSYDDIEYDENIYGKGKKKSIPEDDSHKRHIVSKAKAIGHLFKDQIKMLKDYNQYELYKNIELPLSDVLSSMEFEGIGIDKDFLENLSLIFKDKLNNLEKEIFSYTKNKFNISSPKQLGEILFNELKLPFSQKNKTGFSTNADILNKLIDIHPIISLILKYRMISKLNSTYVDGIRNHIMDDGKIHTIYKQALTTTGRLSSVEPNLQNIPIRTEEGKLIRKIFKASNNRYFLGSDYSQIELRVLAHVAKSKTLIDTFNRDEDVHNMTAKKVFGVEEIDSEMRRVAKAVNFGIIYGISSWSLAEDIKTSQKKAQDFIDTYFSVYPEIKTYMNDIVEYAKKNKYVETILKRRRYIPELDSKIFSVRKFGERTALNAPIQGSAADIIKLAMIKLKDKLQKNNLKSKLILQVHDELILEVLEEELEEVKEILRNVMENAYELSVNLKTSMSFGKSWVEVK